MEPMAKKPKVSMETPRATFPVMTKDELAPMLIPYEQSERFTEQLQQILEEHGMAVVEGVLSADECANFEQVWRREITEESAQPAKKLEEQARWVNVWLHVQGELAWKARLHRRVQDVYARIYGTTDLSCGLDAVKHFSVLEGTAAADNVQWLHVDQNTLTGLTRQCYQAIVYVWPSGGEDRSTTVVWPGSHKEKGAYGRLVNDPLASERAKLVDESGVHFGHYIQLNELQGGEAQELQREAVASARRVPVPAGAMLLWNSRTTHQGWSGGRRLAVPVCYEPRQCVGREARRRKLFMAAAGLPSNHSPSEGRVHPCVATRRGPGAQLRRPTARPFCVLPPSLLPAAEWDLFWSAWEGERYVEELTSTWEPAELEKVLKPEVAAVL